MYNVKNIEKHPTASYYNSWILMELSYFFIWVFSLILFVMYAYCRSYKSIMKRQADKNIQEEMEEVKR